jgi:hypothetical protein
VWTCARWTLSTSIRAERIGPEEPTFLLRGFACGEPRLQKARSKRLRARQSRARSGLRCAISVEDIVSTEFVESILSDRVCGELRENGATAQHRRGNCTAPRPRRTAPHSTAATAPHSTANGHYPPQPTHFLHCAFVPRAPVGGQMNWPLRAPTWIVRAVVSRFSTRFRSALRRRRVTIRASVRRAGSRGTADGPYPTVRPDRENSVGPRQSASASRSNSNADTGTSRS